METIIYDGTLPTKRKIFDEFPKGELSVVCPKCKQEVIIVLDAAGVEKYGKAPGIYCPNGHFWTVFNLR